CKWRNWIQSCLTSSNGSILVNGCPTNEFQFYKGLKQDDPLSPFLFILVMESLHLSFQRIVNAGMFKGIVKILSNRLVNVLEDIVNEVQSAFIAERQMLNGPFILNEKEVTTWFFFFF
ncbi:hypothetical protein Tco_0042880, partial [Tanacetum coccineum]